MCEWGKAPIHSFIHLFIRMLVLTYQSLFLSLIYNSHLCTLHIVLFSLFILCLSAYNVNNYYQYTRDIINSLFASEFKEFIEIIILSTTYTVMYQIVISNYVMLHAHQYVISTSSVCHFNIISVSFYRCHSQQLYQFVKFVRFKGHSSTPHLQ